MDTPSGIAPAAATAAMSTRQITMTELRQIRDNFGFVKVGDIVAAIQDMGSDHDALRLRDVDMDEVLARLN
ncbi:hypothetical protein CB0940_03630 [Cercospora beticola]|uniref:Uncharacterized protein n=1 Tax=Cercospora beticola TaxID=122368 RepID=A0A2G5I2C6_CERBT|nr:hypothetical protein CB0940_03630 [Cercospora beticola]PIA98921.1 hypothetical protein CB0940_03630 [Cercospora beticola]WPB00810.1 hypothetical protein RHO25_005430 [Cercospora beticola]